MYDKLCLLSNWKKLHVSDYSGHFDVLTTSLLKIHILCVNRVVMMRSHHLLAFVKLLFIFCWPCISIHLSYYKPTWCTKFNNEYISCLYNVPSIFVLIVRRSKLYFTASGIITLISGRPVHSLREDNEQWQWAQMLIVRRSKLYDTFSCIITPTGGRPVHSPLYLCTGRPPKILMILNVVWHNFDLLTMSATVF